VIDNSRKNIDRRKAVASFCMGTADAYDYLNDNPLIEFRGIDYTNNPMVIASIERMTAINSALQIDLTGQATAESIRGGFYSGIGGSADFMRGAVLSKGGKSILVVQSTAGDGTVSRIVPSLDNGAGVTFNRGDIHYVVTEYGIAYLHGKNVRERAMDLIAIAHPSFRPWLIDEAKCLGLIYKDQAFIPGEEGNYPEHLETPRHTSSGLEIFLRPVRMSDEELVKDFFYALSDKSLQQRFMTPRMEITHEVRQRFVVIDYRREMVILACLIEDHTETVVGIGQYRKWRDRNYADLAIAVRDDFQRRGIGTEILSYLSLLAKNEGLEGFTADVSGENRVMQKMLERLSAHVKKTVEQGLCEYEITFDRNGREK